MNIVNCSFIIHITFIVRISYSLETDWCNVWDCFDFSFSIYIHYSDPDYALFWNWDYHNILEHNVLGETLPTFQLFCIVMISRLCSVQCSIVHLFWNMCYCKLGVCGINVNHCQIAYLQSADCPREVWGLAEQGVERPSLSSRFPQVAACLVDSARVDRVLRQSNNLVNRILAYWTRIL